MTSPHQLPSQSGHRKYLIWLIPMFAFVGLFLLMKASGSGQATETLTNVEAQLVTVMPVALSEQYQQTRKVIGTVEATQTTAIGFDSSGLVQEIFVDEGQPVTEGQLLAQLDQQRLLAQKKELSATLMRAKAEANLAQLSLQRIVDLVNKKLEPVQRLDEARESKNAANALVNEITARTQTLDVEIDKTKLFAPYAGIVTERFIDQGAVVTAGQPLFNVQQINQLQVRFAMPAKYSVNLQLGEVVEFIHEYTIVQGVLKSISGKRRLDTQTVDLIAQLDTKRTDIMPGDLLQYEINQSVFMNGFWMPREALVSGVRGLWSLFVVEEVDGKTKLVTKLVELLHADAQNVFVRGALKNNDKIVIEGVQRLVPGQEVALKTESSSTSFDPLGMP